MVALGKTEIVVAVIGGVSVIAAAAVQLVGRGDSRTPPGYSTTCRFTFGPRAGETQYYSPNTPGLTPAVIGGPCTDGARSIGYAIKDE